jgi:hypothetical protein
MDDFEAEFDKNSGSFLKALGSPKAKKRIYQGNA